MATNRRKVTDSTNSTYRFKIMKQLISARQSGRTTRMLKHALDLAVKNGHMVYILTTPESIEHTRQLANRLYQDLGFPDVLGVSVKLETKKSLGEQNLDLDNLKLKHAHPNCILLADHFFYEYYYSFVLKGFHMWDSVNFDEVKNTDYIKK